jgi:hypothetical protein
MEQRSTGTLAAASAFVLVGCLGAPAVAQDMGQLAGTLDGSYAHYDTKQGSPLKDEATNQWQAGGSAVLTVDNPGGNIQLNFDNSGVKVDTKSSDDWGYGADAYWRDYAGDFGVNITGNSVSNGKDVDYYTGGFFGEFFALSDLTLRAKGGGIHGDFDGWYGDSGVVFYPYSDLALSFTGDYARIAHSGPQLTDGAFSVEYLPVRDVPVSLAFGYTYARYRHLAPPPAGGLNENVDVFSVALKVYFGGGSRRASLVDYQRGGPTDWDGAPPALVGIGF